MSPSSRLVSRRTWSQVDPAAHDSTKAATDRLRFTGESMEASNCSVITSAASGSRPSSASDSSGEGP